MGPWSGLPLSRSVLRLVSWPISGGSAVSWLWAGASLLRLVSWPISGGSTVSWLTSSRSVSGLVVWLADLPGQRGEFPVRQITAAGPLNFLELGLRDRASCCCLDLAACDVERFPRIGHAAPDAVLLVTVRHGWPLSFSTSPVWAPRT